MKREIALILAVFSAAAIVSGEKGGLSAGYRDIERMELIQTLGIDRMDDGVLVTAGVENAADEASQSITGSGSSLAETLYNMEYRYQEKQPYFRHTENILISIECAENDIREFVDYVARMPSLRLMTDVFILRDGKCDDTMEKIVRSGGSVPSQLANLRENEPVMGAGTVASCRDIYGETETKGCCVTQAVKLTEQEPYYLVPAGTALLSDYRLDGFLSEKASGGASLILNKVETEEVCLSVGGGTIDAELQPEKLTIELQNPESESPTIYIGLELQVSVVQVCLKKEMQKESIALLAEMEAKREAEEQLRAAVEETQTMGKDYLGVGEILQRTASKEMGKLRTRWEEIFPKLPVIVECRAETIRMYDADTTPKNGEK